MKPSLTLLAALLLLLAALPTKAATFTYSTLSGTPTENWSSATGWSGTPVSASDTTLTFEGNNTNTFATGAGIISNNDVSSPPFLLNVLNLQGTGAASGASGLTIQGNALQLTGANATVNLNALIGAGTGLTYEVKNNITLASDTLFTGNGTVAVGIAGGFNFSGTLSGSGNLTKTGTSRLTLGNGTLANGLNDGFLYSGNLNVSAGTLAFAANGAVYTKSQLTINSGGTVDVRTAASVFSIFGTAGTLYGTAGSQVLLFVNYTGTNPAAGFTGTISGYSAPVLAGSGDLTFGTIAGAFAGAPAFHNFGTGIVTALSDGQAAGSQASSIYNPFGTLKLTGSSGRVNGAGVSVIKGTLIFAPSGSGNATTVTGQWDAVTGSTAPSTFRYDGHATLKLDKGANTSVNYQIGTSTSTSNSTTQILRRFGLGTLVIDPVAGVDSLGSTAKFTILQGATQGAILPTLSNGLAKTSVVVVNNDSTRQADFVTYNGTGISSDVGFQKAVYNLTDTFAASSNASVVKITANQTIGGATSAFALRNDATITINSNQTLTLGNPVAGASTDTQSAQTGLILNGGTIAGPGTLAFGASEATIYTSGAGGTIGAIITGTGSSYPNGGNTGYAVSLTKFGPGTLYLTNASNTYSGITAINSGAVDVGPLTSPVLPTASNLLFVGGVLQASGNFTRSLGLGANQATWNNSAVSTGNSGGFAARGGNLTVAIGGQATPTALTWGNVSSGTEYFITEAAGGLAGTGVLVFGSDTSDSQVDFRNAINLGANSSPLYYRTIMVNQGTGADSAKISGVISSTVVHGIIKDGAGKLILTGNNTYSGDTVVAKGSLVIGGDQTGAAGSYTVNPGATLQLGEGSTAGQLATASAIVNNGTFIVNRSNAVTQGTDFSAAAITGTGAFTQAGAGITTFTASNSYTGATQVLAGTLLISGSIASSSPITVISGATVQNASGAAITSSLTLGEGSSLVTSSSGSAFSGAVSFSGNLSDGWTTITLTNTAGSGLLKGGAFTLTLTGITDGTYNLTSPAGFSGTFASMNVNGNALSSSDGGSNWTGTNIGGFDYAYANSSNILIVTPEPTTWALLAFSLTAVIVLRRRRE